MAIPDFQTIMLPLLRLAQDGKEHSIREAVETLAKHFHLSDVEISQLQPSGQQPVFENRIGWARTYMKKAGLLTAPRKTYFQITPRGLDVLSKNPKSIGVSFMMQFPEFEEFRTQRRSDNDQDKQLAISETDDQTPEDNIERSHAQLQAVLSDELLTKVKRAEPSFFEQLVVDLLFAMGYGGSRKEAARAIGRTGDGGIDGVIDEDRLGLDIIVLQAKRWEGSVGRPDVQKFVGAVHGARARKGVLITTSSFTKDAVDYVRGIDSKIILIDGDRLTNLMIDYNIGVTLQFKYELKKIDTDYFPED